MFDSQLPRNTMIRDSERDNQKLEGITRDGDFNGDDIVRLSAFRKRIPDSLSFSPLSASSIVLLQIKMLLISQIEM